MASASQDEEGVSFETAMETYNLTLKSRASQSLDQLREIIGHGRDQTQVRQSQDIYNTAERSLRDSLNVPEPLPFAHRRRHVSGPDIPALQPADEFREAIPRVPQENLLVIIANLSNYIKQLEGETKVLKEKQSKHDVAISMLEKQRDDYKKELQRQIISMASSEQAVASRPSTMIDIDGIEKWERDLSEVKLLHEAKVKRLEAELLLSNEEVASQEKFNQSLREKLREMERQSAMSLNHLGPALCVKCGQQDAVLAATHSSLHVQKIERLLKERKETDDVVDALKRQCEMARLKEGDSYEQVKKSVVLVEQAQLDRAEALLKIGELDEEITRMQRRIQDTQQQSLIRLSKEREQLKEEANKSSELLLTEMERTVAERDQLNVAFERLSRDKMELLKECAQNRKLLDEAKGEVDKLGQSLRVEAGAARIETGTLRQELAGAAMIYDREQSQWNNDRARISQELEDCRRRINLSQSETRDLLQQLSDVTETKQHLEGQLSAGARQSADLEQRLRAEMERGQTLKGDFKFKKDQIEARYKKIIFELEDMLVSQNALMSELRQECKTLSNHFETLSIKHKTQVRALKDNNRDLVDRKDRAVKKYKTYEKDASRQRRAQDKLLTKYQSTKGKQETQEKTLRDLILHQRHLESLDNRLHDVDFDKERGEYLKRMKETQEDRTVDQMEMYSMSEKKI